MKAAVIRGSTNRKTEPTAATKKARNLSMLPLGTEAYDFYERPEAISPKPFTID